MFLRLVEVICLLRTAVDFLIPRAAALLSALLGGGGGG